MTDEATRIVAVASQNRREVTGHLGRCRRFWVYPLSSEAAGERRLVELSLDQSLHAVAPGWPPPLDGVDVVICAGMGTGMARRLAGFGVEVLVTSELDPDVAVRRYLAGDLPVPPAVDSDDPQGDLHA